VFTGNVFARRSFGLESSAAPDFDFSATPVTAVEFFTSAESSGDARLQKLLACSPSKERDEVLSRLVAVNDATDKFIHQQVDQRRSELAAKRAELWGECRRLEDRKKQTRDHCGMLNSTLNDRLIRLSSLKQQIEDARPRLDTRYPSEAERSAVEAYARKTGANIAAEQDEIATLRANLKSAHQQHQELSHELFATNEKLREVDSALNALQKSS
jgi:chromosome segregation ATPase